MKDKILNFIKNEKVRGVIRHLITALGGVLVSIGIIDADILETLTGALMSIYGVILSIKQKNN